MHEYYLNGLPASRESAAYKSPIKTVLFISYLLLKTNDVAFLNDTANRFIVVEEIK
jgi:hypothetical protein